LTTINEYVDYVYAQKKINPPSAYLIPFLNACKNIDFTITEGNSTSACFIELKKLMRTELIARELINLVNFQPLTYLASKADAKKDLIQIKGDTASFNINSTDYIYFVKEIKTYYPERDITFSFGNMEFYFFPSGVKVDSYSNGTRKNGEYHPYVKGGQLCLGQYEIGYKQAFNEMRFGDAYDLVMDLMTRYGGDELNGTKAGPHNPFHLWIGVECEICGGSFDAETMTPCNKTHTNICEGCLKTSECKDEITGTVYLPKYIELCESCGKKTVNVKNSTCGNCRRLKS
jgi:hypothetical protein